MFHQAVLCSAVLEYLNPGIGEHYLDCTTGLGGHARLILEKIGPSGKMTGLDRDESILMKTAEALRLETNLSSENLRFFCANFADIKEVQETESLPPINLILADLGVNSVHLDTDERGFSFQKEGPLDMRFNQENAETALELLKRVDETTLANIIYRYGEERRSRKIANRIKEALKNDGLKTTLDLARICSGCYPPAHKRGHKIHPATRTFQALRISVNGELDALEKLLNDLSEILAQGGRAAFISFHSLEDRLIKIDFRKKAEQGLYEILTKKPVMAGEAEKKENPRARSAKLRVIRRL